MRMYDIFIGDKWVGEVASMAGGNARKYAVLVYGVDAVVVLRAEKYYGP